MDEAEEPVPRGRKRRFLRRAALVCLLLVLAAAAAAWFSRERIAEDLIGDALRDAGVEASYTVESIAPEHQVLRDVVIGDPARPDFTAERVELTTALRFGLPEPVRVRLISPRLYGSYRGGKLSFGALDPLIFTDDETPFEWPALELDVEDGRGLIDSDFGRVGLTLSGSGHLRDGFAGEVAAVAPALAAGNCVASEATLYGAVRIEDQQPYFTGPLRFARAQCGDAVLADGAVAIEGHAASDLASFAGELALRSGAASYSEYRAASLGGDGAFSWRGGVLTTHHDLTARAVVTPFARLSRLQLAGRTTAADGFARLASDGEVSGAGLDLGSALDDRLAAGVRASDGTLLAPLLARMRGGLTRELSAASVAADYTARRSGAGASLVIGRGVLRGRSGASVLALSDARLSLVDAGLPRFSGNFATGGEGLPRIAGRMEQAGGGPLSLRLRMSEYAAGDAQLAVPELALTQGQGGRITLAGRVLASGPLPGGHARALVLPVDGVIGADGALAMWSGCRDIRFDSLQLASLSLGRQSLRLCPQRGQPILRYGARGLQVAFGTNQLNLRGNIGGTPLALASSSVGFAWPGSLAARELDVTLGPRATASRFLISDLSGNLSSGNISGTFAQADVFLDAVPLDIMQAAGNWSYADGRLDLSGASFTLHDREEVDRFKPLVARDAALTLLDNRITAAAALRETRNDSEVATMTIVHDLASATGHADLQVAGVTFRPNVLQPRDLSELAYGVVSLVDGSVSGSGRIDWDAAGVTSSGAFTTAGLDFAAPFGPVTGASGTVVFSDLIGLTTAPGQLVQIAAVNPGIEIYDGELSFSLKGGEVVQIDGGTWPFLGGTLRLRPVTLNIGVEEIRTYVIAIEGLEAAGFVERMEMNNIAATGVFDGVIPIVFDAQGNGHLTGGSLVSRAPGGNLSYVGQLTYEDLSYMGNLAFNTLRDLRFTRAEILLDGPLTGELVTRVNFAGVGQGATARGNFITRKIAELPIELRLNIRAPFYQLIATTRSIYDPSAVRDPRSLGLITDDGTRLRAAISQQAVDDADARAAAQSDEPDIQPPESEALP